MEYAYYLKNGDVVCVKSCPSKTKLDLSPGSLVCRYDVQEDLDSLCADASTCGPVNYARYLGKAVTSVQDESCLPEIKSTVGPWYQCFWDLDSLTNSSTLSEYDINLPTDFVKMEDGGGFDGFMADGM